MVEGQQGGRRVRAATAQSAAHGDALGHPKRGSQRGAGGRLQRLRGTHHQVLIGRHAGRAGGALDRPVVPDRDADVIVQVDELEDGLQVVEAVGRRPVTCRNRFSLAGAGQTDSLITSAATYEPQSSTTRRTRTFSRVRVTFAGSDSPFTSV